jgi:hypothetical protein
MFAVTINDLRSKSDVLGMPGERSNVKSRSRLEEPGWIDIKGGMSATPKQTFDVYRKRTNPTMKHRHGEKQQREMDAGGR